MRLSEDSGPAEKLIPATKDDASTRYRRLAEHLSKRSFHAAASMEYGNANLAVVNFMSSIDKSDSNADSFGHSYFRNAPTVSSDLILMLRDDLDPGTPGRPLEDLQYKFWRVPPGYPSKN